MKRLIGCALWIGCLSSPLAAQIQNTAPFQPPTRAGLRGATYLPFTEPGALRVVADMDLDGDEDLILFHLSDPLVAANGWDGFQVWSNVGRGRFEPRSAVVFAQTTNVMALLQPLAGDVNGDGFPDLVVSSERRFGPGFSGFEVHFGTGDGNFQGSALVTEGDEPYHITLGNIDADAALEIAVDHSGKDQGSRRHVRWWNHDPGGFVGSEDVETGSTFDIHAMDVNADGLDDLVVGLADPPTMLWFLPTVGRTPTAGALVPMSNRFQQNGSRIHSGDVSGDGIEDIFLSGTHYAAGTWLLQSIVQSSTGVFSPRNVQEFDPPYPAFNGSYEGQLADWDLDGDLDFIANEKSVVLWENDGLGVFAYAGDFFSGVQPPSASVQLPGPGVTDMNDDGWLDAVGPVSIYYNQGGNLHQRDPDLYFAFLRAIEDWEGDGDIDLIKEREVWKNDGRGGFSRLYLPVTGEPAELSYRRILADGDFDGDGDRDFIGSYRDTALNVSYNPLLINVGNDTLQYGPEASPVGNFPNTQDGWPTGDLDGDGDLDLVHNLGHWLNDGSGQFTGPVSSHGSEPMLVADVDGDGDTDVVGWEGSQVILYANDGTAVFAPVVLGTYPSMPRATSLDLDDDGDRDLVILSTTLNEVQIFENHDQALALTQVIGDLTLAHDSVAAFDVTGDGRSDLITYGGIIKPNFYAFKGFVALRRKPRQLEYHGRTTWLSSAYANAFVDVDGDGDTDALTFTSVMENDRFIESEGRHLQYGSGSMGSGGFEPVLGFSGPARLGHTVCHRVRRGLGGALAVLNVGLERVSLAGPQPGLTLLVDDLVQSIPLTLGGTPGVPGQGEAEFCFPVSAALFGLDYYHQVVIVDGGVGGSSATNGTLIHFGRAR